MDLFCEVSVPDVTRLSNLVEELERIQSSLVRASPSVNPEMVGEMRDLIDKLRIFNEEQEGVSFEASKESPIERLDAALNRALDCVANFRRHHAEKIAEKSLASLVASLMPLLQVHLEDFAGHIERWKKESKISLNRVGHVHSPKPF